jgi:hypothetical protein
MCFFQFILNTNLKNNNNILVYCFLSTHTRNNLFIFIIQMLQNIAQTKPVLIFGTRHGSVYNLTPSNLPNIQGVQLSVGDFYHAKKTIENLP